MPPAPPLPWACWIEAAVLQGLHLPGNREWPPGGVTGNLPLVVLALVECDPVTQVEDYRRWLTTQRGYLQALLVEYRNGSRSAIYTLPDGKRIDETAQVIAQLENDIQRLTLHAPPEAPASKR